MNNISITVIVPTFNRSKLIEKCVSSVLKIKDNDIKMIVIDNHSTDNTIEKLKKFQKDNRFKLLKNNSNYERSYSRNVGLKEADTEFITFLDSDDYLEPNIFNEFRKYYEKNSSSNIYFCDYNIVDKNNDIKKIINNKKNFFDITTLSYGNYLSNIGVFINKRVYKDIKFDEDRNIIGIEDYDFNLRMLIKYKIAKKFSNKKLANVYEHTNRSVNLDTITDAENRFIYFREKILYSSEYSDIKLSLKKNIIATACIYLSLVCVINGNRAKSLYYLLISVINSYSLFIDKRLYNILIRIIY